MNPTFQNLTLPEGEKNPQWSKRRKLFLTLVLYLKNVTKSFLLNVPKTFRAYLLFFLQCGLWELTWASVGVDVDGLKLRGAGL